MDVTIAPMTVEEFEAWAAQPIHGDREYEYINGKVVEIVANPYSAKIAARISWLINNYVIPNNLGHVTGADGGFMVGFNRFMPDVAFISADKQAELPYDKGYNPLPPDLAVEVLSPSNDPDDMRIKVADYLAVGTVVWVVNPPKQRVEVYIAGEAVRAFGLNDTIDASPVLTGLKIAVKDIFPEQSKLE